MANGCSVSTIFLVSGGQPSRQTHQSPKKTGLPAQTYVQSSVTGGWLSSGTSDTCQKAHQRMTLCIMSVELLAGSTSVADWRRKPGRPRSSWLHGVLKDVQLTAQEAWTAADDREGWRV